MKMTGADTKQFIAVTEKIFAPVYPVIAADILRKYGKTDGTCLDVGCGPGSLGLAIADAAPGMKVFLLDVSETMLEAAKAKITGDRTDRVETRLSPVETLPFEENSIDLVVSRGSIFFWENVKQGLEEIYRVLKPGGFVCVGGGFGNRELFLQIRDAMAKVNPGWEAKRAERIRRCSKEHFTALLQGSRIPSYTIENDEVSIWIQFSK